MSLGAQRSGHPKVRALCPCAGRRPSATPGFGAGADGFPHISSGKLHSGMKTYGCELCGKRFLDSLRLRMHLLAHSAGAKALVCDQCGAQFSKEDALETHRQTHTGTWPFLSLA
nr:zinc finger and BTB domain-containing protein 16-like [Columba livia]